MDRMPAARMGLTQLTAFANRHVPEPSPDPDLFAARVDAVTLPARAFVYSVLTLDCPTLLPVAVDVLSVVLLPDDAAAKYPGWDVGMTMLPWYAAVAAGIVGPGAGPHTVPRGMPTANALQAALTESRNPAITSAGLSADDHAYAASLLAASLALDPLKGELLERAAEDFAWDWQAMALEGFGHAYPKWLAGVFGTGPLLGPEHVRTLAAFINPFADPAAFDEVWVCATPVAWANAPPRAKRMLAALDHAAANRLCVQVV